MSSSVPPARASPAVHRAPAPPLPSPPRRGRLHQDQRRVGQPILGGGQDEQVRGDRGVADAHFSPSTTGPSARRAGRWTGSTGRCRAPARSTPARPCRCPSRQRRSTSGGAARLAGMFERFATTVDCDRTDRLHQPPDRLRPPAKDPRRQARTQPYRVPGHATRYPQPRQNLRPLRSTAGTQTRRSRRSTPPPRLRTMPTSGTAFHGRFQAPIIMPLAPPASSAVRRLAGGASVVRIRTRHAGRCRRSPPRRGRAGQNDHAHRRRQRGSRGTGTHFSPH